MTVTSESRNPQIYKKELIKPDPLLSVCVVTCLPDLSEEYYANRLDIIYNCLGSINKNSPVGDMELIIWDNGSIWPLRRRLADWYSATVIFSPNIGPYRARRNMFHLAKGKYLCFTDDDVEFLPGWFDKQREVIDAYREFLPVVVGGRPETPNWRLAAYTNVMVNNGQIKTVGDEWVTHGGVKAKIGSDHMQFLTDRETFPNYPSIDSRKIVTWASYYDNHLTGYRTLGLSTSETVVRHTGRGEVYGNV